MPVYLNCDGKDFSNILVSVDEKGEIVEETKTKTGIGFIDWFIKFFRHHFERKYNPQLIIDKLTLKTTSFADKSPQEIHDYLRYITLFKRQIVDVHNQRPSLGKTPVATPTLDQNIDTLAQQFVDAINPTDRYKEPIKTYLKTGTINLKANNVSFFVEFAHTHKLTHLKTLCDAFCSTDAFINDATSTIDKFNILADLAFRYNLEMTKGVINGRLNALAVVYDANFPKVVALANTCSHANLKSRCEVALISAYQTTLPELPFYGLYSEYPNEKFTNEVCYEALNTDFEKEKQFYEEAHRFGFKEATRLICGKMLSNILGLTLRPNEYGQVLNELRLRRTRDFEKFETIKQNRIALLAKLARSQFTLHPDDELAKVLALSADTAYFRPEETVILLRYLIPYWQNREVYNQRLELDSLDFEQIRQFISLSQKLAKIASIPSLTEFVTKQLTPRELVDKAVLDITSLGTQDAKRNAAMDYRLKIYPLYSIRALLSTKEKTSFELEKHSQCPLDSTAYNKAGEGTVTIVLMPNDTITVQKEVLCAHSRFFHSQFTGGFGDHVNTEISLQENDNLTAFVNLVKYMYTSMVTINEQNVCGILELIDLYDIITAPPIIEAWKEWVIKYLHPEPSTPHDFPNHIDMNFMNYLINLANRYDMAWLKNDVCTYVLNWLCKDHGKRQLNQNRHPLSQHEVGSNEELEACNQFLTTHGKHLTIYAGYYDNIQTFAITFPNLRHLNFTHRIQERYVNIDHAFMNGLVSIRHLTHLRIEHRIANLDFSCLRRLRECPNLIEFTAYNCPLVNLTESADAIKRTLESHLPSMEVTTLNIDSSYGSNTGIISLRKRNSRAD